MKGLILNVYRPAGYPDCTNDGVSSRFDELVVVGYQRANDKVMQTLPSWSRVFVPRHQDQAVVLVESWGGIRLVPLGIMDEGVPPDCVGPMMGGNYAGSSDSRWKKLLSLFEGWTLDGPVRVHDRVESQSQYKALSF